MIALIEARSSMKEHKLIISKTDPQGRDRWVCWVEGGSECQQIHSIPEGVKWAYQQGTPVHRWQFHGDRSSLPTDSIRFSAYQISQNPEEYEIIDRELAAIRDRIESLL